MCFVNWASKNQQSVSASCTNSPLTGRYESVALWWFLWECKWLKQELHRPHIIDVLHMNVSNWDWVRHKAEVFCLKKMVGFTFWSTSRRRSEHPWPNAREAILQTTGLMLSDRNRKWVRSISKMLSRHTAFLLPDSCLTHYSIIPQILTESKPQIFHSQTKAQSGSPNNIFIAEHRQYVAKIETDRNQYAQEIKYSCCTQVLCSASSTAFNLV